MNTDLFFYHQFIIMKKLITLIEIQINRMSKGFAFTNYTKWVTAILLLTVTIAACKKVDNDPGIVAPCPVVVSTDPMPNAVDVALNKTVSITFNTDMNAATVTGTTFTLKNGTQIIPGIVSPTTNGAVYTFKSEAALLPFVKYTGTVIKTVADKYRTNMVDDYTWSFTTIPQISLSAFPLAGGIVTGAGLFAQSSTVTVVATPSTGYTFTNWTDSGSTVAVSTSPSYQYTMSGNRKLVANFALIPPAQFAVNTSSLPTAGGATFGSGSYNTGTLVTVIESPNPGYTFVNWTEGTTIVSTNASYQFTLTANRNLVANFTQIPALLYAVILSANPSVGGTTSGAGSFVSGTSVTINASANTGYSFVNWTEGTTIVSTSAGFTFPISSNRTFVANFAINTFTLGLTANPLAGGTVTKTADLARYDYGTLVQLTATANAGYSFTNYTEGTTVLSTNPGFQISMTSNRVIVANFTQNSYTLTLNAFPTAGGTVSKTPNQATYTLGTTVQIAATANSGYTFTGWTGDTTGTTSPLTITMRSNKNITANFAVVAPAVALGTAANFGAFGGNAGVTNQGINTVINNGSLGTTAASTLITGFHDATDTYTEVLTQNIGNVTGVIYTDVPFPGTIVKKEIADRALNDARIAYLSMSPASKPGGTDPGAGELGGLTLAPGVYKSASGTFSIFKGNLTLDAQGDPNASWIFQTAAGLTVGIAGPTGAKSVLLINGAAAKNVFWYVGSSAVINGAGGGVMSGTIIANSGVTFSTAGNAAQTVLNGRALSLIASVTMVNTTINNQ